MGWRKMQCLIKKELQELFSYRELLYILAYRNINARYKQSIMGFLGAINANFDRWSRCFVRYAYAFASGKRLLAHDVASVAVKSLPWLFSFPSIRFSCNSLINNQSLVTKVYTHFSVGKAAAAVCMVPWECVPCSTVRFPFLLSQWKAIDPLWSLDCSSAR